MEFEIKYLEELDSTNSYLQRIISGTLIHEGYVVAANEQLSGRGYGNNSWESEKGKNLTFSLLLTPYHIPPVRQFAVTTVVSVAIAAVLDRHLDKEKVCIKWPNDIYVGPKKIAGMLIQNGIQGSKIASSIIGIGININQELFHTDTPNPVSLIQLTNRLTDLRGLLEELLQEIGAVYQRTQIPSQMEVLDKTYLKRLYRIEEWTTFKDEGNTFLGRIKGVGEFGRLKIETELGEIRQYGFKEVEMIF